MSTKTIIPCPVCSKHLRIPGDLGELRVTCPYCHTRFIWPLSELGDTEPVPVPAKPTDDWGPIQMIAFLILGLGFFFGLFFGVNLSFWVAGFLAFVVPPALVQTLVSPLVLRYRLARWRNLLCPHGVPGGQTSDLCPECRALAERIQARREAEKERQRREEEKRAHRQEIASKASAS